MLQSCSVKFELRKLCVVLQNSRWNFVYVVMLMRNSKKPPSLVLVAAELSWPEWGRSPRRKFRLGRPDRRPRRRRHARIGRLRLPPSPFGLYLQARLTRTRGRLHRTPLVRAETANIIYSVRCIQPIVFFSHTKPAPASSHQTANNIFLSQEISTRHSTANRGIIILKRVVGGRWKENKVLLFY